VGARRPGYADHHRTEGTVLELQSLTGGYGGVTVLRDVSVTVPDAAVVAMVGPNGAGKSTTLKMASGLLRPHTGRVLLDGKDVTRSGPASRARAGMCHLIEGRGIFPSLTVRENVVLFSPKGKEAESFEQAVAAFPILGQRRHQQAGTMSGGEQQMLALTRAYLSGAKLVLVDEASLGLAPLVVDAIFEFLGQLAGRNMSLLLVEQYVNRALALADSVYVMNKGEIVFTGASSELNEEKLFALYAGEAA
jgi:branched-chain amino acid transport system ATP-binding protein